MRTVEGEDGVIHAAVALMIDDPGSRDLDDAIAVHALPTGGWEAVVYIAGVAAAVAPGSRTDEIARKRVTSVYRPGAVYPMLGEHVERAATLAVDADREVLAVSMRFASDGMRIGAVGVDRRHLKAGSCVRLPYADAPAAADDPGHRWHRAVQATYALATALRAQRSAAGALAFYDLIRGYAATEDGRITLIPVGRRTVGYMMVEELMIAAGTAVADWCIDHDVPILFRNHRTSLLSVDGTDLATDIAASVHDPELFEQLRHRVNRSFGKAVYDASPRGHHGLRVPAYAHVTSPLRRYPDLVSQQMLWAQISGDRAPYSHNQLAALAEHVNGFVAAQQQRRDQYFLDQKRRNALRGIAERNYSALDASEWRRMFDLMTQHDPVEGIEAELSRRLDAEILLPNDVARMAAAGPTWTAVRQSLFPKVRERHPEFGPSAVSGRAQILGQDPTTVTVETVADPSLRIAPRFAARVGFDGHRGAWQIGPSKKTATAQAMWELLDVLCGHRPPGDGLLIWPDEPDRPAEHSTPAAAARPVDATGVSDRMRRHLEGLSTAQRDRALSNPVAWLTSITARIGLGPLETEYSAAGPEHALEFVCTAAVAGVSHTVTATTKAKARVTATTELLAAMLEAVPYRPTAPTATHGLRTVEAPAPAVDQATVSVHELPDRARRRLAALTGTQQVKAFKNPGAWLTNFSTQFGLGTPAFDYAASGPADAQVFSCTVTMTGMSGIGHGPSKIRSRTAAMERLLRTLLEQVDISGIERR